MGSTISYRDLEKIPGLLVRLHAATEFDALLKTMFEITGELVSSDSQNYNEVFSGEQRRSRKAESELTEIDRDRYEVKGGGRRLRYFVASQPLRTDLDVAQIGAAFERHVLDHPVLVHSRSHRALETHRLSDLVTDRALRETPLFQEFFRHFPVRKQLVTYLDYGPGLDVVLVSARGPGADFVDRDLQVMRVLGPHLRQAWLNVRASAAGRRHLAESRSILARHHLNYVRLTPRSRIAWITPEAERCLASYFPKPRSPREIPDPVAAWLRRHPCFCSPDEVLDRSDARPLEARNDTGRLILRVEPTIDGGCLLALNEERTVLSPDGFSHPGLTAAENRVLYWISQGRANANIATLLSISARTVNKHIQNLFSKMGVTTRSEAMVAVMASGAGVARGSDSEGRRGGEMGIGPGGEGRGQRGADSRGGGEVAGAGRGRPG